MKHSPRVPSSVAALTLVLLAVLLVRCGGVEECTGASCLRDTGAAAPRDAGPAVLHDAGFGAVADAQFVRPDAATVGRDAAVRRNDGGEGDADMPECLGTQCSPDASDNPECLGMDCPSVDAGPAPDSGPNCPPGAVSCTPSIAGKTLTRCADDGSYRVVVAICDPSEECGADRCVTPGALDCSTSCHHGDPACNGRACGTGGTCVRGMCESTAGCLIGPSACLDAPATLTVGTPVCGDTRTGLYIHSASGTGCNLGGDLATDQDWAFVAPATATYTIQITVTGTWKPILSVRDESCRADRCLGGAAGSAGAASLTLHATAGKRYFVIVDGAGPGEAGAYHLQIQ